MDDIFKKMDLLEELFKRLDNLEEIISDIKSEVSEINSKLDWEDTRFSSIEESINKTAKDNFWSNYLYNQNDR
ncbi:MAG TPA: hypothetical protein DCM73_13230 [Clostridiales bacterium]|nr:hypothetical protein [Clostridiales bacterium]